MDKSNQQQEIINQKRTSSQADDSNVQNPAMKYIKKRTSITFDRPMFSDSQIRLLKDQISQNGDGNANLNNIKQPQLSDDGFSDHESIFRAGMKAQFTAKSELHRAKMVIFHEPQIENFLFGLHPIGALYEDESLCRERLKYDFHFLKERLQRFNVDHISVRDALKKNIKQLKRLAGKSLKYFAIDDVPEEQKYYISDEYKQKVLNGLALDTLVDIVLNRPIIYLECTSNNTMFNIQRIESRPIGNLIFCRDQQITTQKGVVIGRLNSPQRSHEIEIMKSVFMNLDIKPIGHIPDNGRLEGGDFMIIKEDLALLGLGLRSNYEAAFYLMKYDLLGCKRFGLVIDDHDFDQQRMHLDTIFNIVSKEYVILQDFSDTTKIMNHQVTLAQMKRKLHLYERQDDFKLNDQNIEQYNFTGKYIQTIEEIDFEEFLVQEGFKVIKISDQQQKEYMINFINLGESEDHKGKNDIIAVHPDLQKHLEANGCYQANVDYVDFSAVKKMYGAIHCATQIARFSH